MDLLKQLVLEAETEYIPANLEDALYCEKATVYIAVDAEELHGAFLGVTVRLGIFCTPCVAEEILVTF